MSTPPKKKYENVLSLEEQADRVAASAGGLPKYRTATPSKAEVLAEHNRIQAARAKVREKFLNDARAKERAKARMGRPD